MKKTYFVIHDPQMYERQSDGVELCIIPEFHNNKIYFYCSEYQMFWDDIASIGDGDKCCNFSLKGQIRPATLSEICSEGLADEIKTVKQYDIESSAVFEIKYIHI